MSSPAPACIEPMEGWQAKRSKDRMAKPYRVNAIVRINNTMISSLLRLGIKMWSFSLLTVRGRKSGKPIVTPYRHFCSGTEALPDRHVWGRQLGAQPPCGRRSGDTYPGTAQQKDSCHRAFTRGCGTHFSRSPAFWPSRCSHHDLSHVSLSPGSPLPGRHRAFFA